MKKIFIGLSGGMGPVLRTLPVAAEHRLDGDTVAFSMYDKHAAAYLESLGYRHLEDHDPSMPDPSLVLPRTPVFYHLDHYYAMLGLADPAFTRSWILSRITMLEAYAPDLVYADLSPHTVIAAKYLGIPLVSVTQSCFHPKGRRLHHWTQTPRNITRVTPVVNRVLEELGLPAVQCMEELLTGDATVIPSIPELDFTASENVHYTGPVNQPMIVQQPKSAEGAECPDVIVYAGRLSDTSGDSGLKLVSLIADAFRGKSERVAIVYSGQLPVQYAKALPPQVMRVERFGPEWLMRAKLYIHHGGHGSCLSSIQSAIPALIVPTHSEREYNARSLWELGGCEYVLPDACTADHFYSLSKHVMADDYRRKLEMLRESVEQRRYGGAKQMYRLGRSLMRQETGGRR